MRKHRKLLLMFIGIILAINAKAQIKNEDIVIKENYTIGIQPFYLVNGGLKIDFEKKIDSAKKWIQIGISGFYLPTRNKETDFFNNGSQGYYKSFNSNFDPFNSLKGIGVSLAYKQFIYRTSLYYNAGLSYTYYNVKYQDYSLVPFIEDHLIKYRHEYLDQNQKFNKIFPNINIGIQSPLKNKIFVDAFFGIGYSYSFYDADKYAYKGGMYGFGYRGIQLNAGIRGGIAF